MDFEREKREREEFRAKRKERRDRKRQKLLSAPELHHAVAVKLLAQGFLNEALARDRRTTPAKDFYQSRDWASARYAALLRAEGRCACCGAARADGATLHVDHIKPRSKFPELALSLDNLQVLCDMCNVAKSNIDMTDWNKLVKPDDPRGAAYREYREEGRRVFQLMRDDMERER